MDGVSDVLRRADEDREYDQEDARVAMVESVNQIVVVTDVNAGDLTHCTQDTRTQRKTESVKCILKEEAAE